MLYNRIPTDICNIGRKYAVTWSNAIQESSATEPGLVSTQRPVHIAWHSFHSGYYLYYYQTTYTVITFLLHHWIHSLQQPSSSQ